MADILALCLCLGCERMFLVGHDWGAVVAWALAAVHPDKVRQLVILNVPHPAIMPQFLFTYPRQLLRSWYMFFFQMPRLPELLLRARNCQAGVEWLSKTSPPERSLKPI